MEEVLFGHILLRTHIGEVISLDLYENPALVCRGVYLPPEQRRERTRALAGLELVADRAALDEMSRRLPRSPREGEEVLDVRTSDMEVYGEISSPIESAGRLIWAGALRGAGIGQRGEFSGEFTFVLEREGSIEIYVLLVVLFRLVFAELSLDMAWQRCLQQAVRQCGEGNVKVFNLSQRLGGLNLVMQGGCQVECFERS
jgi:hypothetical protein